MRGVAQYIMLVLVIIFMLAANVLYTNHVDAESDARNARQAEEIARNWCALLIPLDERYRALPPDADPAALAFARSINDLRTVYRCADLPPVPIVPPGK